MRFHVAFKIFAAVLNGKTDRGLEYQVNAKVLSTNILEADIAEIVLPLKHKIVCG